MPVVLRDSRHAQRLQPDSIREKSGIERSNVGSWFHRTASQTVDEVQLLNGTADRAQYL
jgi:hypothetical protein